MASTGSTFSFDPGAAARRLAALFDSWSDAVDKFRLSLPDDAPPQQVAALKDRAQVLESLSHHFTAEAIGATLAAIQGDLAHISEVTAQAKDQMGVLKDVARVIAIAGSVVQLGSAIAAGNAGDLLSATEAVAQELAG